MSDESDHFAWVDLDVDIRRIPREVTRLKMFSDEQLAAHDREVAARAWDEGYGDDIDAHMPRTNPYRKENSSEREDN